MPRPSDPETPFLSIESAQEYVGLLKAALEQEQAALQEMIAAAESAGAARRLEALRLVEYKLSQLHQHVGNSGRLLNDLRSLRRLLLNERQET